ncbi:6-oxocyclohex-1-ene-1-carbonyl-CoA hydratase [Desulfosporosinus sp.]|uniref:6-oxocyclohex-1-ene-1-carbonyl-CoA hydratase n=1 Tax=Desulfosporosinus sp. TaxID=157907 RepID=UPI0025C6C724|nr:6-oxocyclohex-1-ene-1-carbonyl-CoA hydratase [Desulfosporosinus sp.]MBC2722821.1 6-oxocyclohex-1-ene-1-carbonyl-CoA hydratase [Desulfosporosinus sp.]MBC2728969.1 6-oxocyclohex-1-ene-1-carbonyl-CoA hydratase [Desulfosporosinus sp.]
MDLNSLNRWPRQTDTKNHELYGNEHFGTEAPSVLYEKKPILDPQGNIVPDLYSAWVILNNPSQFNSYTTEMVKGVIAGMQKASADRSVVAVIFTAVGDKAFCTGGNTKEYSEYYSMNGTEYGYYMDLFNAMVDGILNCKKPVICRVNGMRVAGGQEIGLACDLTVASDLAVFGQAGPKHGSAPVGGATDFLPEYLTMEQAMWNCISCEMWSAYKVHRMGMISKTFPVLKVDGKFIRNPMVKTENYVEDGEIVYGDFKTGEAAAEAKKIMSEAIIDFTLLDKEIDRILYVFTNLFPNCLMMSIDGVRGKKKFFWDQAKLLNRHWLVANMQSEAYMGFNAFNNKKTTGKDTIDFIKYRQLQVECKPYTTEFFEEVMAPPLDRGVEK